MGATTLLAWFSEDDATVWDKQIYHGGTEKRQEVTEKATETTMIHRFSLCDLRLFLRASVVSSLEFGRKLEQV